MLNYISAASLEHASGEDKPKHLRLELLKEVSLDEEDIGHLSHEEAPSGEEPGWREHEVVDGAAEDVEKMVGEVEGVEMRVGECEVDIGQHANYLDDRGHVLEMDFLSFQAYIK